MAIDLHLTRTLAEDEHGRIGVEQMPLLMQRSPVERDAPRELRAERFESMQRPSETCAG